MEASPTHQVSALHAALGRIHESADDFSPSGLALEIAQAIDGGFPEFEGVLGFIVDGMLCSEQPDALIDVLGGFVQERARIAWDEEASR